jgi:hypothetical protein
VESFNKRQKEMRRLERQRDKAAKRKELKALVSGIPSCMPPTRIPSHWNYRMILLGDAIMGVRFHFSGRVHPNSVYLYDCENGLSFRFRI